MLLYREDQKTEMAGKAIPAGPDSCVKDALVCA